MAMLFGNRQNNQKDSQPNVNTRGIQMMNIEGIEPSTLSINAWNDMFSVRINPALEPSKRTEGRLYDYDRSVNTSLNAENVVILLTKIKEKILPAIENDEEASVALLIANGASLLVVGTGKKKTGEIHPYLAIYKNLNENTRLPEMGMIYEFKSAKAVEDYDEKTGDYTLSKTIQSELNLFIRMLESYLNSVGKFTTHFDRVVNRYHTDRMNSTVNAIAEKVGANTNFNDNGRYQQRRNIFSENNSYNHSNDAEQETLNDISELSSMLEQ